MKISRWVSDKLQLARDIHWMIGIVLLILSAVAGLAVAAVGAFYEDPYRLVILLVAVALIGNGVVIYWWARRFGRTNPRTSTEESPKGSSRERERQKAFRRAGTRHQREIDEKDRALKEESEELSHLARKYKALQFEFGKIWIDMCGRSLDEVGLSVSVQFIDHQDNILAQNIIAFSLPTTWNVGRFMQIKWRENPRPECRIVIFSDHRNAPGLRGAFTRCELLDGERIERMPKEDHMTSDVTIVIFDKASFEAARTQ